MFDEAEGFAYLRQRPAVEAESDLPRLIQRRQLSYPVRLILVLLRKRLTGLVISGDPVADQVRLFLPDTANEARLVDRIDAHLNKVIALGFLRPLRRQDDHFEVRRILKAFVDAQWLAEFEQRLAAYAPHAEEEAP